MADVLREISDSMRVMQIAAAGKSKHAFIRFVFFLNMCWMKNAFIMTRL